MYIKILHSSVTLLSGLGMWIFVAAVAQAEIPKVVTDIAPVHALVKSVIFGTQTAEDKVALIIDSQASPHDNALKPSSRRALQNADILFWVGPDLSPWMTKAIKAAGPDLKVVTLSDLPNVNLQVVKPDPFSGSHKEHDHNHDIGKHALDHHHVLDPHAWLDVGNAVVWTKTIEAELSALDPANAMTYRQNASDAISKIRQLETKLNELLSTPLRPYVVYHDAFAYFESSFALKSSGTLNYGHTNAIGVRRFRQVRQFLDDNPIACLFVEPGTPDKAVASMTKGYKIRRIELDPIGFTRDGLQLSYTEMMENLAAGFLKCAAR